MQGYFISGKPDIGIAPLLQIVVEIGRHASFQVLVLKPAVGVESPHFCTTQWFYKNHKRPEGLTKIVLGFFLWG